MAESFFVRFRGRTVGPYSLAQAQQMARKGQLSRTSEVSNDGQAWRPASSFPEIFERPASTALVVSKASSLSLDDDPSPLGSVTSPSFEARKVPARKDWYYTLGSEQKGPTPSANIVAMINDGTLTKYDRVWQEGLSDWVSICDVEEFDTAGRLYFPSQPAGSRSGTGEGNVFCRECGNRINRKAVICPNCGVPTEQSDSHSEIFQPVQVAATNTRRRRRNSGNAKSRTTAALLAFFLGGLGVHHFYLGNILLGFIYLLFCMTLIPACVAFVEMIVFLCMSDEAFDAKYNT